MAKTVMSYKEFMAYAEEHYYNGGDAYVECWDEKTFDEYVAISGGITKRKAMKMFRENLSEENERIEVMFHGCEW